jgi:DNA-binding XRE family transcriptional regulator
MSFNLDSVPIDGLSAQQIQALACLSAGRTISEVSHDLGISRQTIYNWQKEPESSPRVALKASLAVLNRPQFPDQGWNLPVQYQHPAPEAYSGSKPRHRNSKCAGRTR